MTSTHQEQAAAMMNLHAHSTTYNLRLPAAPSVTHTRIADIYGEHALPFWLLCLLVWIVVPVAFWGGIAACFLAW